MRIFSWNVNGIRAVLRKDALQNFLAAEHPDILCLQEIKANPTQVDYDFPGYTVHWHPAVRPGYSGTAILVKMNIFSRPLSLVEISGFAHSISFPEDKSTSEILHMQNLISTSDWESVRDFLSFATYEGRILILDCDQFYLVNVYVPNSKPDLSRLKLRETSWDPALLRLLKNLEQIKPVVVCGDFNAAHQEIDLARPRANHHSAGFTDEERQGITNLISSGFYDTFRALHPDEVRYTWWSHWGQARANNVGWRIDYFFISSSLKSHLKDAEIYEKITGSDHCPVSITLEF